MLARVTYALVLAALGTLIGGFVTKDSYVLLYVSLGLSVGAIVLVLIDAARRAREAPEAAFEEAPGTEVISDDVLEAFEEDEIEPFDDEDYEEYEEPAPRPARRAAATRAKPAARAKTTTRAKSAAKTSKTSAKSAAKTSARSTGKVLVVAGRDRYHAAGCRFVAGKDAEEITKAAAKRRGYEACSVCSPD